MQDKYRVTLTDRAMSDIKSIIVYYIALGLFNTAERVRKSIMESVNSLSYFPYRIALVSEKALAEKGLRKMVSGKFLVYFYIYEEEKEVMIVAVIPAKCDQQSKLFHK